MLEQMSPARARCSDCSLSAPAWSKQSHTEAFLCLLGIHLWVICFNILSGWDFINSLQCIFPSIFHHFITSWWGWSPGQATRWLQGKHSERINCSHSYSDLKATVRGDFFWLLRLWGKIVLHVFYTAALVSRFSGWFFFQSELLCDWSDTWGGCGYSRKHGCAAVDRGPMRTGWLKAPCSKITHTGCFCISTRM